MIQTLESPEALPQCITRGADVAFGQKPKRDARIAAFCGVDGSIRRAAWNMIELVFKNESARHRPAASISMVCCSFIHPTRTARHAERSTPRPGGGCNIHTIALRADIAVWA